MTKRQRSMRAWLRSAILDAEVELINRGLPARCWRAVIFTGLLSEVNGDPLDAVNIVIDQNRAGGKVLWEAHTRNDAAVWYAFAAKSADAFLRTKDDVSPHLYGRLFQNCLDTLFESRLRAIGKAQNGATA